MNKTYTVTLEEDSWGDLMLPIPQEILDEMHWHEGTVLEFVDNGDGSWTLREAYQPSIDDMLLHMLGSHELVEIWWNSPNKHFEYEKPCNCNREQVYEYVISHSSYPG